MTISTDIQRTSFTGDGATVAFATTFPFFASADLKVYLVTTASGAEVLKTLTTHYSVTGGDGSTGTVTMVTAPASTETLVLVLDPPRTQTTNLVSGDGLDMESIEDRMDKLTLMVQRLDDRLDRAVRLKDGDPISALSAVTTAALRRGKTVMFEDTAGADLTVGTPTSSTVVAASETASGIAELATQTETNTGTDDNRTVTPLKLHAGTIINALTAETAPDVADTARIYDASESIDNKITLTNLVPAMNHQIFTATGSFAKSSVPGHISHIIVHVWGAGGGGGGADTDGFRAVGGGGGGYSRERIAVSALAASETVTVGAGGTAGTSAATPGAGGAGGTSSFGTTPFCSATGGAGGTAGVTGIMAGVAGGAGSGGDLNLTGGDSPTKQSDTLSGSEGGDGAFGGGTGAKLNVSTAGRVPGGGGSGGNHSGGNGGTGGAGLVIVEW